MGKGVEEDVEDRLMRAAQNGDWLILENLHLVPDWLPIFEEKLSKFKGSELNQRFRIWLTSSPVKNFPSSILEKSIKVAL
jgi:2-phosphoglycerate kinase